MKAQWRLINVDTSEVILTLGNPFDVDYKNIKISWEEAYKGGHFIPLKWLELSLDEKKE